MGREQERILPLQPREGEGQVQAEPAPKEEERRQEAWGAASARQLVLRLHGEEPRALAQTRESKSEWRWGSSLKKERAGKALSFRERMLVCGLQGVEGQGDHSGGVRTCGAQAQVLRGWRSGPVQGASQDRAGEEGRKAREVGAVQCCPPRLSRAEREGEPWRPEEAGDHSGRGQFSGEGCREGWKMSLCVYLRRHRRPDSRARGRCSWAQNRGPGLRWMAEAIEAIGAQEVKG